MKDLVRCYANWRIDFILLLGIVALIILTDGSEELLARFFGLVLLLADIIIARYWRKSGKLQELDNITE